MFRKLGTYVNNFRGYVLKLLQQFIVSGGTLFQRPECRPPRPRRLMAWSYKCRVLFHGTARWRENCKARLVVIYEICCHTRDGAVPDDRNANWTRYIYSVRQTLHACLVTKYSLEYKHPKLYSCPVPLGLLLLELPSTSVSLSPSDNKRRQPKFT